MVAQISCIPTPAEKRRAMQIRQIDQRSRAKRPPVSMSGQQMVWELEIDAHSVLCERPVLQSGYRV
jgi:hypothetical protein